MRRLCTWLAGAAGGLAAYRALVRRRPAPAPAPETPAAADTRAEELREKLARAREPESAAPSESAPPDDPEERRRTVHEQARSALDEMRRD